MGGLHKSMTRLSSSQQINNISVPHTTAPTPPLSNNVIVTGTNKWGIPNMRVLSGGVTVTTISQTRIPRPLSQGPLTLMSASNHSNQVSGIPKQLQFSLFILLGESCFCFRSQ